MERMEILVEPGRLPERGTLVVPVGHDGTLGAAAASLDQASAPASSAGRCAEAASSSTGGWSICCCPPACTLDRLLLSAARQAPTA